MAEETPADWAPELTAYRRLSDGRWIGVKAQVFNAVLITGLDAVGAAEEYSYPDLVQALVAYTLWNFPDEPEPDGWIRHVPSNRRRPDGDVSREYIAP